MKPYEPYYYDLASPDEAWDKFPLVNLLQYLSIHLYGGDEILDIGCGLAKILEFLPADVNYIGLDSSSFAIRKASNKWKFIRPYAKFMSSESASLPFPSASFDFIFMLFSLEHISHPKETLKECSRLLKSEQGRLIILAPNMEFPLAWPNALRHKSFFYRMQFAFARTVDFILRIFGHFAFRVLPGNITSERGIYELKDDDLWHMVSSWEVMHFLKPDFKLDVFWEEKPLSGWRRLVRFLPTMRWYGMTLAAVWVRK